MTSGAKKPRPRGRAFDLRKAARIFARIIEIMRGCDLPHRAAFAFAFGFTAALAFPPTGFFPILWLCFPALIVLLQPCKNIYAAFAVGWSFAFGSLLMGLYWIAAAMFVDIRHLWWGVPLAAGGLPMLFSLYYGIAAALSWRFGLRGPAGALAFALLWFLADYARGHMFTGFPWNLEAYAWTHLLPVLQLGSVTGAYGLTLLTLAAAVLPATLLEGGKRNRILAGGAIILFVFIAAWGEGRLTDAADEIVQGVRLRIVQPDIDQAQKWLPGGRERNFRQLLELTAARGEKPVTHIIWPETAATYYLAEDPLHRLDIAGKMDPGTFLLTGVIRRDMDELGRLHYYNSLVAIDDQGHIVTSYDKFHLVPFGEYIPFRAYLPSYVRTVVPLGVDFSAGAGISTLHVQGLPSFSPLICYEAIFPGEVADENDRPSFLLNITNDGWYGRTAGPYQHWDIARMRAIEEGLPLVRAANTGISGVMDAYGRVSARLDLGRYGSIDADLPQPLPPTFFSRYGEGPLWSLFALLAAYIGWARWREGRGRK